jgi:hypothetical protein
VRDAEHLLSLVRLPPGAARTGSAPTGLDQGPVMGIESATSVIEKSAYWIVPRSLDAVVAWLSAHQPAGLAQSGSESGSDNGVRSAGFSYAATAGPLMHAGQLDVGAVTITQSVTGVRADGVSSWLDPRPIRDAQQGARVRVAAATGCPGSLNRAIGVTNNDRVDADLDRRLVPNELPTGGLACHYGGLNDKPAFGLAGSQVLAAAAAAHIARELYALNPAHLDGGIYNCPADDARHSIYVFSYPDRADVDVWVYETGCRGAANGHIVVGGAIS